MTVDSNTLYYTFSTIAQTLAAAVSVLAAVILYQIQNINRTIYGRGRSISNHYKNSPNLINNPDSKLIRSSLLQRDFNKLMEIAEKADANDFDDPECFETDRTKLKKNSDLKKKLLTAFYKASLPTVGLIAFSILILSIVPVIIRNEQAGIIIIIGTMWFFGIMYLFVDLIRVTLR